MRKGIAALSRGKTPVRRGTIALRTGKTAVCAGTIAARTGAVPGRTDAEGIHGEALDYLPVKT